MGAGNGALSISARGGDRCPLRASIHRGGTEPAVVARSKRGSRSDDVPKSASHLVGILDVRSEKLVERFDLRCPEAGLVPVEAGVRLTARRAVLSGRTRVRKLRAAIRTPRIQSLAHLTLPAAATPFGASRSPLRDSAGRVPNVSGAPAPRQALITVSRPIAAAGQRKNSHDPEDSQLPDYLSHREKCLCYMAQSLSVRIVLAIVASCMFEVPS
jgi:hypothetical protein